MLQTIRERFGWLDVVVGGLCGGLGMAVLISLRDHEWIEAVVLVIPWLIALYFSVKLSPIGGKFETQDDA